MEAHFPLILLLYLASLFAQPRSSTKSHKMFLRARFASFVLLSLSTLAAYKPPHTTKYLLFATIFTLLFHYALILRAIMGRLPDKELNNFLMETLFMGGFKAGASEEEGRTASTCRVV